MSGHRFLEQVAAVTGTTSGIGQGIAQALEAEGARVFGLDVEAGGVGEHVDCDVRDPATVARAAQVVVDRAGRVDHFVANAGIRGVDAASRRLPVGQEQHA